MFKSAGASQANNGKAVGYPGGARCGVLVDGAYPRSYGDVEKLAVGDPS